MSSNSDPAFDPYEARPATDEEAKRLRAHGYFSWGSRQAGSWIQEQILGDVLTTDEALGQIEAELETRAYFERRRQERRQRLFAPPARASGLAR